ncbi:DUF2157 domain-containing protein [Pannonibacter tanglangensis]|uniref:DUF2157 domain-containing protein n=1 Tax=Pannonibacter tanglangensis TaxID=2750084 RepID=A0ABW9ZF06_9HYPH|nr:DUF2157 domain-containing protein [Pannonibacter sp. XCT-34]NBN63046.1 DUF2157 domain-containing protein [Pannonibacter sp. XCT-34]
MFDQLYERRLRADIETWIERGWVTREGAARILADRGKADGRSRLPLALATVGMICIALAVTAFIAANWDDISRSVRLAGIVLLVVGANMVAARAHALERPGLADLATAFAAMVFVAGLSLVGQMFHLPQDWTGGALLVCAGCLAAAWIGGSRLTLALAGVAAIVWVLLGLESGAPTTMGDQVLALGLVPAVAAHAVIHPARLSRWCSILLAYIVYLQWLLSAGPASMVDSPLFAVALAAMAGSIVLFGTAADHGGIRPGSVGLRLLARSAADASLVLMLCTMLVAFIGTWSRDLPGAELLSPAVVLPSALLVLAALAVLRRLERPQALLALLGVLGAVMTTAVLGLAPDQIVVHAALALGTSVAVAMAGIVMQQGLWTLSGHAAFTAVALWLLSETIGSLLGQALFFLLAGIVLIGMAFAASFSLRMAARWADGKGDAT